MDDLTREFLAESLEGLDRMERCLTALESRPEDRGLVDEIFRAVHTIKGATGFLGFGRLEALAHTGENLLGALRSGRVAVSSELISGLLALHDGLLKILRLIETTGGEGQRSTDDDYELIARMVALNFTEPVRKEGIQVVLRGGPDGEKQAFAVDSPQGEDGATGGSGAAAAEVVRAGDESERRVVTQGRDTTLRVDVDVLNRMMNLIGELVLMRNQILQSSGWTEQFPELGRRLDALTSDLRNVVMEARMQPVSHLFGKYPRMVRDLARVCGREVRLEFEGQRTELDKSLIEAVRDPLTHAVRNAVDHGIESPADRVAAGKSAEGTIRLRASSQKGAVVIEVLDDGAGISTERVLARAVERGLVTAECAAAMSGKEAIQLLFAPGFSTADAVTNVSGRGVGLDVVRSNVEEVGGTVELESWPGLGTALRLRMPLTLAIAPALIVRCAGRSFALPQSKIVELLWLTGGETEGAIATIGGVEVLQVREVLLSVVRLKQVLGLEKEPGDRSPEMYAAVVEAEGRRYALVVDDLLPPEEIVVKPISPLLRGSGVFLAATVLGSGALAMVLDVGGLGERAGVKALGHALRVPELAAPVRVEGEEEQYVVCEMARVCAGRQESGQQAFTSREIERVAFPLAAVERIESVQRSAIQFAGGRALLQQGDELIALEDEGGVLSAGLWGEVTVLICSGARRCGVVVNRVVDVCSLPQGTGAESDGSAVVSMGSRATSVRMQVCTGLHGAVAGAGLGAGSHVGVA